MPARHFITIVGLTPETLALLQAVRAEMVADHPPLPRNWRNSQEPLPPGEASFAIKLAGFDSFISGKPQSSAQLQRALTLLNAALTPEMRKAEMGYHALRNAVDLVVAKGEFTPEDFEKAHANILASAKNAGIKPDMPRRRGPAAGK